MKEEATFTRNPPATAAQSQPDVASQTHTQPHSSDVPSTANGSVRLSSMDQFVLHPQPFHYGDGPPLNSISPRLTNQIPSTIQPPQRSSLEFLLNAANSKTSQAESNLPSMILPTIPLGDNYQLQQINTQHPKTPRTPSTVNQKPPVPSALTAGVHGEDQRMSGSGTHLLSVSVPGASAKARANVSPTLSTPYSSSALLSKKPLLAAGSASSGAGGSMVHVPQQLPMFSSFPVAVQEELQRNSIFRVAHGMPALGAKHDRATSSADHAERTAGTSGERSERSTADGNESMDSRKRRRKQRNRESAQRSRNKKKSRSRLMEQLIFVLTSEVHELRTLLHNIHNTRNSRTYDDESSQLVALDEILNTANLIPSFLTRIQGSEGNQNDAQDIVLHCVRSCAGSTQLERRASS
eukprot:CAMPEP_0182447880 /NCGR_PEP_ID=MMETSP1172-20130603/21252_1 /TAXON_ID=708627 /ORGANISM="Timspurckia oligopyrenoides, Strain CCMP3278" /LENGTH=408 /DNA_ID=CAMNT_0024644509 /DNA_START=538 /DNA_END=1764 /DNA_ORIENTATION=+